VKFTATKIGETTNYFPPPLFVVVVVGSGIRDTRWKNISIRDKHPGAATLAPKYS
jgi:hypothetical protein